MNKIKLFSFAFVILVSLSRVANAEVDLLDPYDDFYSYKAKYLDKEGADLIIPAKINPEVSSQIRKVAVEAFLITECRGMARVDFFLKKDNTFILNEINTLPGFTKISMFPKLWESSGLKYKELLDKLIELAIE